MCYICAAYFRTHFGSSDVLSRSYVAHLIICIVDPFCSKRCIIKRIYVWSVSHNEAAAGISVGSCPKHSKTHKEWLQTIKCIGALGSAQYLCPCLVALYRVRERSVSKLHSMLLVIIGIHPTASWNHRPFMHIVPHKVWVAYSISFKTWHGMLHYVSWYTYHRAGAIL